MTLVLGISILVVGVLTLVGFLHFVRQGYIWQSNVMLIATFIFVYGGVYFLAKP